MALEKQYIGGIPFHLAKNFQTKIKNTFFSLRKKIHPRLQTYKKTFKKKV
jgi:hypothetical protein